MNKTKKIWLTLVFLLIFGHSAYANGFIQHNIIKKIESGGNALAHRKTATDESWGLYQITRICLQEWNNFHPKEKYVVQDLYNAKINEKIAIWYLDVRIPQLLRHFKLEINTRNIIICYNAGISNAIKRRIPTTTQKYLEKYDKYTK